MPLEFPAGPAATPHKSTFNGNAMNAPPTQTIPNPAPKKPAAAPVATPEADAELSKQAKADAAIAKAKEGSKRFHEEKAARARSEKMLADERARAANSDAQARRIAQEREQEKRAAVAKAERDANQALLGKNPAKWLEQQADELLALKERDRVREAEVAELKNTLSAKEKADLQKVAHENFLKAAKDKKAYPNLSKLKDSAILRHGIAYAKEEAAKGKHVDDDEILAFLNEDFAGNPEEEPIPSKTPEKKSSETNQASDAPRRSDTPRTITNEISKPYKVPANFDEMSDRQQRKELAKVLRATSKK